MSSTSGAERWRRGSSRHQRSSRRRARSASAAALAIALIATAALSACGSSGSNETVVQVAGASPISKALVDHWMRIEAVLSYRLTPTSPLPAGVIPDPPEYKACSAFLSAHPTPAESALGKRTPAQLKSRCQQKEEEIRRKALGYMIAYRWVGGELASRGLSVTKAEVDKAVREFESNGFTPGEFRNYLTYSGESPADLRFIVEYTVMGTKLQNDALLKKGTPVAEERHALADFTRRWTQKTTCKAAYLVAGCKGYKGTETPL